MDNGQWNEIIIHYPLSIINCMKAKDKLKAILLESLKPVKKITVSEWSDRYRMLPTTSSEPGRWRTSRVPYMREVMDAFTDDKIHTVVAMTGSQLGKALDIMTPIATLEGFKLMRDLAVGDKVFSERGEVCEVVAATGIMYNHRCYEVEFSDASKIVADAEHLWQVQDNLRRSVEKTLTTAELRMNYKAGVRNRYAIPVTAALELPERDLLIEPYTLGCWLGDGNSYSAQMTLHKADLEIAERIRQVGYEVVIRGRGNVANIQIEPESRSMHSKLAKLGVLRNKHIPAEYLRSSARQRLELLRGLMDTDGTITADGFCNFDQKNERLAFEVLELLRTLGFKPTIRKRIVKFKSQGVMKESASWRIFFVAYEDQAVFHLRRKKARLKSRTAGRVSETFRRRIISIREVASRPVKCIAVNSGSHLYLAGESLIPTHNSETLNNIIGRYVQVDPTTIMMIQPSQELAEKYSKTRIQPMIQDTKSITQLFYKSQTILTKFFVGGQLIMTGSNSPANLASQPVRIVLCDEVDRFCEDVGDEGDPISLAKVRTSTFWNYKIGLFSTPTLKDFSRIEQAYLEGTQEEYSYECPNCGMYHKLDYRQMVCDKKTTTSSGKKIVVVESVRWQCPDCGFEFTEREMKASAQKYIMKNSAALANGVRSFWVNTFSSPWLSWSEIMREWYEAVGNEAREKVVVNTRFAETYQLSGEYADESQFLKRREDYGAEIPEGVKVLTCAVDVQGNRLEFEVAGWSIEQERWGIWRGMIAGSPTAEETWQQLDAVIGRIYYYGDGRGVKISRTFIDSGYSTDNVYRYCAARQYQGVFAVKGQGAPGIPLLYQYGRAKGHSVVLVMLGVNEGKGEVYARLGIEDKGAKYMHFPKEDRLLMRGYGEIYFKEILSERRVIRRRNGIMYAAWEKVRRDVRNESLDLMVYNLAAVESLNLTAKKPAKKINNGKLIMDN